jgi:RNA polymerase sigma factor (sigma-70 family)
VRDDPAVVELVVRARDGDADAWDAIVQRYAALVWGICRRYGLSRADAEDAGGGVWLLLVEHLPRLREPAALPGWIATTTRRECLRLQGARARTVPVDAPDVLDALGPPAPSVDEALLAEERRHALRTAFAELQERCRQLLTLLFADPPPPYQDISAQLGIPVGAIGPNRKRCLDRLRRSPALARLAPVGAP